MTNHMGSSENVMAPKGGMHHVQTRPHTNTLNIWWYIFVYVYYAYVYIYIEYRNIFLYIFPIYKYIIT
jgi:hypothetical protein